MGGESRAFGNTSRGRLVGFVLMLVLVLGFAIESLVGIDESFRRSLILLYIRKINISYRLRGGFMVGRPSFLGIAIAEWMELEWNGTEWNGRNRRKSLQQLEDRSNQPASGLAEWPPW